MNQSVTRRSLIQGSTSLALAGFENGNLLAKPEPESVIGEIGLTTGSFFRHIAFAPGDPKKIQMLDLPKIMRDELDMRVIDLLNRTMNSFEPKYLEKLRKAADDHGCFFTNLKCNQKEANIASPDQSIRKAGIKIYRESIDAAELLGCRWIRPTMGPGKNSDRTLIKESLREMIDYAAPKGISILIENVGWVGRDPDAIPEIIKLVGKGLDASPDTGNWPDDETRTLGLKKAYPLAVTSDFKAFQLEEDGSHPKYDLENCFRLGWEAGYRGPWCIEHFNEDLKGLIAGFGKVRDMLRGWIAAAAENEKK